jgi:hypothetical protein
MGRPPLHKSGSVGVHLKVSAQTMKRIKANLGEDETPSAFIRKAIEQELRKRERRK